LRVESWTRLFSTQTGPSVAETGEMQRVVQKDPTEFEMFVEIEQTAISKSTTWFIRIRHTLGASITDLVKLTRMFPGQMG